jgi:hypothetical protein
MMMRFHTGLGVGHMHARGQAAAFDHPDTLEEELDEGGDERHDHNMPHDSPGPDLDADSCEQPPEDCDDGFGSDSENSFNEEDSEVMDDSDIDDEELLAADEMYG